MFQFENAKADVAPLLSGSGCGVKGYQLGGIILPSFTLPFTHTPGLQLSARGFQVPLCFDVSA